MPISTIEEPVISQQQAPKQLRVGMYVPEELAAERYIALGIVIGSFLYLCLFRRYSWIDPDEGIILQGAQRILDGQVLYRDFFSFFTPGSYYLHALISWLFGDSITVQHTVVALLGAGFSPFTYLLSRRVCSRSVSLLVTVLMTTTALPLRFLVLHNWDSTLLACIALYSAVRFLESRGVGWAFATASLVSLTAMFEQSKGAGLFLGLGVGLLVITLKDRDSGAITGHHLMVMALGLAWPVLLTALYFASQHSLATMLGSWFWPLQHYSVANRVPYGYPNLARLMLPGNAPLTSQLIRLLLVSPLLWIPVLPLFAVAMLLRLSSGSKVTLALIPEWRYYVLISAALSGLLVSVIIVRTDYIHFIYLHPCFMIVVAWLLGGRNIRNPFVTRSAPLIGVCLVAPLLMLGAAFLFRSRVSTTVVTRRGALNTQIKDEVLDYVQTRVPAGEAILIYPYDPTYYYLTRTKSPTSYEFYQPGMHTREQALDMLAQLRARPVRVVLFELGFSKHIHNSWPNTRAGDLVSDPVADYIARNYRVCASLQSATSGASSDFTGTFEFLFMVPRELTCH